MLDVGPLNWPAVAAVFLVAVVAPFARSLARIVELRWSGDENIDDPADEAGQTK